jgi:hypothetical protein
MKLLLILSFFLCAGFGNCGVCTSNENCSEGFECVDATDGQKHCFPKEITKPNTISPACEKIGNKCTDICQFDGGARCRVCVEDFKACILKIPSCTGPSCRS